MESKWRLVIHGGPARCTLACSIPRPKPMPELALRMRSARDRKSSMAGKRARCGRGGGPTLEEHLSFNAGRGSVLARDGHIELDAAIMDGRSRRAGAVAALRTTRAPISLARHLLEQGPHVFLAGADADRFAAEHGFEQVENCWFETTERRRQLDEYIADGGFDEQVKYGTIGAVAIDASSHVASATSTGGLTGKQWGRSAIRR
jgi:beta-aspartyl-peptidase (threonine type)